MPVIDAAIVAAVRAEIDSMFGAIPSGLTGPQQAAVDAARNNLATSIAKSGKYVRDFGTILVASVSLVTPGVGVSGPGTGTIT